MKSIPYLLILCALLVRPTYAQIGMGGQPHPSAALDVKSPANNKGLLIPRLSTAQRNAIASPAVGLLVFDLDKGTLYLYDGQNWLPLATTSPNNLAPIDRTASDGVALDYFGISVAISGDYAIVGAYGDDIEANARQGSAYVFVRSGSSWIQQQKITASDGAVDDFFGWSVAISGDYAIVGAYRDDIGANPDQGSAYVFVRGGGTWTQQQKLTANDGAASDFFGDIVAISGNYAIAGAPNDNIGADNNQGSAYVFVRSGSSWTQQQKLTASDGAAEDFFGRSVAISGDYAIVGANSDDNGTNSGQGSAYVFVRGGGTWTQQQKITASDGAASDFFGSSVAISGDYAIVGASSDDIGADADQGSAYVFVRSGSSWTQQARLIANDGAASDFFGYSVAISGDYAIVGAYNDAIGANNAQGSAYVFVRNGTSWSQVRQVTDNSPTNTTNGSSVGLSNGSFIIGGPGFENAKGKVSFGTVDN